MKCFKQISPYFSYFYGQARFNTQHGL